MKKEFTSLELNTAIHQLKHIPKSH